MGDVTNQTAPQLPRPSGTVRSERVKRMLEIGAASAAIVGLLVAAGITAVNNIADYMEDQINLRTKYNQAVMSGQAARTNEQFDYAIGKLTEAVKEGVKRNLDWDELAYSVDNLLTAITDSGEQQAYARNLNEALDTVDKYRAEDPWYYLQKGYRDLLVRDNSRDSIKNFSIALERSRNEGYYLLAAVSHRARSFSYIAAGDINLAAQDLASAAICDPLMIDYKEASRYIRRWFNELWIKRWFDSKPEHKSRALEVAEKLQEVFPTVEGASGGSCADLPTIYWDLAG
jgi:hypothetical protein